MIKVLVVEDDPINMRLMREILSIKGFTADEAEDGKIAIIKAEKEIYDLLLIDIGIPHIDGVEVMKIIKSKPGYENVPAIAITSYAMKGDRERFLEAGFDDYISKPIEVADLIKRLERYRK